MGKGGNICARKFCQPGQAVGSYQEQAAIQWRADHLGYIVEPIDAKVGLVQKCNRRPDQLYEGQPRFPIDNNIRHSLS